MRARHDLKLRRRLASAAALIAATADPLAALARPEAPGILCDTYPDAANCLGRVVECRHCHDSTFPVAWNSYGITVMSALEHQDSFAEELPAALQAVEGMDADADGVSNIEEILGGTYPGDPNSFWVEGKIEGDVENPQFNVGEYDWPFALNRASILYCGHSPSYEDAELFRDEDADRDELAEKLHDVVDACLNSDYWRTEGLVRLADPRIRPDKNAGADSDIMIGPLRLVIGDYEYDYRLWVHALTENHDARDLLLAQYWVVEQEDGSWTLEEDTITKPDPVAVAGGQPLPKEFRAGMLTTQWFLARNTMFSDLPRTSAAAAYSGYLGADIAKTQGLLPVPGEPDDVDNRGVAEPRCAACHSTLDPLAYAFARYEGIIQGGQGDNFGNYDPERPARRLPGWSDEEQQPVIFGQEVNSLREWAEVAANSDAFARNLAQIFYEHALSRGPTPDELDEFNTLWQSLPEDEFSANRLIHRLVESQAFGVP